MEYHREDYNKERKKKKAKTFKRKEQVPPFAYAYIAMKEEK